MHIEEAAQDEATTTCPNIGIMEDTVTTKPQIITRPSKLPVLLKDLTFKHVFD